MAGYQTGDANRITSDGVWNYTHDAEGNVTSKTKLDGIYDLTLLNEVLKSAGQKEIVQ